MSLVKKWDVFAKAWRGRRKPAFRVPKGKKKKGRFRRKKSVQDVINTGEEARFEPKAL